MKVNQLSCLKLISDDLIKIIEEEVASSDIDLSSGVVINFRDPDYSAESGGYHPVEIAVRGDGTLLYITDFSFAGRPPFVELEKELDFDFGCERFQHFGHEYPIRQGLDMYKLWQQNFVSYYEMGVYTVEVGAL